MREIDFSRIGFAAARSLGYLRLGPHRDGGGVLLDTDEAVVAIRAEASVVASNGRDHAGTGDCGALYVTTRRLIYITDNDFTMIELDDVDDTTLVADRLLLALKSGRGVAIQSRLLRQLHATLNALRAERQVKAR